MSTSDQSEIEIYVSMIKRNICGMLLSNMIDHNVNSVDHVKDICLKANNKLRSLALGTLYIGHTKKEIRNSFLSHRWITVPLTGWFTAVKRIRRWKSHMIESMDLFD